MRACGAVAIVALALVGTSASPTVTAQSQSNNARTASFEVASVKVSAANTAPTIVVQSGGRFVSTHTTIAVLLALAFRRDGERPRRRDEFSAIPDWVNDTNFDVVAKTSTATELPVKVAIASDELRPLLQSLLVDRFKLQTHVEIQQRPIYNLMRTSTKPELAPELHRSTIDCNAPNANCGANLVYSGRPKLTGHGATMRQVASVLPGVLARPVLNLTELEGRYDFVLQWSRAQDQPGDSRIVDPPDMPSQYAVPLVTALRDQLGLKLESATGPVDVVVIDHIERPTED